MYSYIEFDRFSRTRDCVKIAILSQSDFRMTSPRQVCYHNYGSLRISIVNLSVESFNE